MNRVFGILFILTGFFAMAGGLYTWGDGIIFEQNELMNVLIPWADIIFTGPISIACGYGLWKKHYWSEWLGLVTSGIYLFGSVLVFIILFWKKDYSLLLIIPATSGLFIALGFIIVVFRRKLI